MPTDVLESPLDPSRPDRRRVRAVLLGLVAALLVAFIVLATLVNHSLAASVSDGIGLTWFVVCLGVVAWVFVVGAARAWLGRPPFGAGVVFGGLAVVMALTGGGYQLAERLGHEEWVARDRAAATACTDARTARLTRVELPGWYLDAPQGEWDGEFLEGRVRYRRGGDELIVGVQPGPGAPGKGIDGFLQAP